MKPGEPAGFPDSGGGRWPQWGGPGGNFKVPARDLAESWPDDGPLKVWSRALGPGYSGVVADRGALFTLYRDGSDDVVIAMRADDGRTVWERRYAAPTRPQNVTQFGQGPNATPLIADDVLVTLGYTGILAAQDLETGEPLWTRDLIEEFDGRVLDFGYSASPILQGGRVVVLVGGSDHAVIAFDPDTGEVVWGSDPGDVSYATPTVIELEGQAQIVYLSSAEVIGLAATDGRRLWSYPCANEYRNNATGAIWSPDERLLWVATQLDGGTRVLHLERAGDETRVEEVWSSPKISIHFWNAVLLDDHVYASIGGQASVLAAIELRTGRIAWRERGLDQVNFVVAGDRALLLDADGNLAQARLSPDGLEILGKARVVDGVTWTAPALVGQRVYIRDKKSIRALDLSPGANGAEPADAEGPDERA